MNMFIPKFAMKSKQFPAWYTPKLRHRKKCIDTLRRRQLRKPTESKEVKLRQLEMALSHDVQQAKISYESELLQKLSVSGSSDVYKYIRSLKESRGIPHIVCYKDTRVSSSFNKATLFNEYFHSVFTRSSLTLMSSQLMSQLWEILSSPRRMCLLP